MTSEPKTDTAVVLAAGWGSRIQGSAGKDEPISKPLIVLNGVPMIVRVIRTLAAAGIRRFVVVTGYLSERVEDAVLALGAVDGLDIEVEYNPHWHDLANGVSLLSARKHIDASFVLSMSDHVFDLQTARELVQAGSGDMAVRLCIDRKIEQIFDLDDATKVRTEGGRIVAIGKTLDRYDAIDTGLFLCQPDVFQALEEAYEQRGDCSLSDGMSRLGEKGRFGFWDIGEKLWQDVDTPEMLARAERLLADCSIRFLG